VGPTRHPFCLSPIVAGGPLRAKATAYAALRAQGLANFSRPLAALAGKLCVPDLAHRAPRPAQISSARRQKNGRQRPSPKGTTEMTDTIAVGSHSLLRNLTRNGEQWRIRQVGETKRRLGSVWTLHVWHGVVAAGLDAESRGRFWVYDVDCVSTDRSVGQSGWRAVDRAGWSACTSHTGRASVGRSRGHHPGRCRRCTTRPRS
jgi:hypothetical protein